MWAMKTPPDRIPPEDRPDFRSYDKATWLDTNGRENKRYLVRPSQDGSGFEIVDTCNGADYVIERNIRTAQEAERWMRVTRAP